MISSIGNFSLYFSPPSMATTNGLYGLTNRYIGKSAQPAPSYKMRAVTPVKEESFIISIIKKIFNFILAPFRFLLSLCTHTDPSIQIGKIAKKYGYVSFYKVPETPDTEIFGNFYSHSMNFKGKTFKCAETAFQAEKFAHDPSLQWLVNQFTHQDGDGAVKLARKHDQKKNPNWISGRLNVQAMEDVVRAKFRIPQLKSALLATGKAYLVEHIPVKGRDAFWGDDNDGSGQNRLGKTLMKIRGELGGTGIVSAPPRYQQNPKELDSYFGHSIPT